MNFLDLVFDAVKSPDKNVDIPKLWKLIVVAIFYIFNNCSSLMRNNPKLDMN